MESHATSMESQIIAGQLNEAERRILSEAVLNLRPKNVVEVGTWRGGGSTFHILRALNQIGMGHLWGIEACSSIYEEMIANIQKAVPQGVERFTPLLGFSEEIIPKFLTEKGAAFRVDLAFLDGGDNPGEQIAEFLLLDPVIPVGGCLMSHDAKLRKGKWLTNYLPLLDHWKCELHDVSGEGLFEAVKIRETPSPESERSARRKLARLRLQPIELIGRLTPSWLCNLLFKLMPRRLELAIGQGR